MEDRLRSAPVPTAALRPTVTFKMHKFVHWAPSTIVKVYTCFKIKYILKTYFTQIYLLHKTGFISVSLFFKLEFTDDVVITLVQACYVLWEPGM